MPNRSRLTIFGILKIVRSNQNSHSVFLSAIGTVNEMAAAQEGGVLKFLVRMNYIM